MAKKKAKKKATRTAAKKRSTKKRTAKKQSARHHQSYRFQYAAKFICASNISDQSTDSLLPGDYRTVVNVHNPHERPIDFRAKVAPGGEEPISEWVPWELGPDGVRGFDCRNVEKDFRIPLGGGAEGFLVIESMHSLDVIAVYTAGTFRGEVASIDVERVHERELARG